MQSKVTLSILFLVAGLAAVGRGDPESCPELRNHPYPCFESDTDDPQSIELYDRKGELCLSARFSIDLIFDDDSFVEDFKKRWCRFHIETKNYKGICAGENAILAGDNVTGPAVVFSWNQTRQLNEVRFRWEIVKGMAYLDEIKIRLMVPDRPDRAERYLSAKLNDLHLFPTSVGTPVLVETQDVNVFFKDSSRGCLVFEGGDYTISAYYEGLSVVTVVVLAIILGILMALGVLFYHKGSRKKSQKAIVVQT